MSAEVLALPHTYLVFKIGGMNFGFEARFLWEAAAAVAFTEVPLNRSHLLGVAQLHGKIIPVLDLAGLLDVPPVSTAGEFVTVQLPGPPEILAGFEVEAVAGFARIPKEELPQARGNGAEASPYLKGWAGEGKKFLLLDIEKIIGDQAREKSRGPGSRK